MDITSWTNGRGHLIFGDILFLIIIIKKKKSKIIIFKNFK